MRNTKGFFIGLQKDTYEVWISTGEGIEMIHYQVEPGNDLPFNEGDEIEQIDVKYGHPQGLTTGVIIRTTQIYEKHEYTMDDIIYYSHWSRDCDMCESTTFGWCFPHEYDEIQDDASEWAEGPMSFEKITKEEYEQYKGESFKRDRVMEAYENGNGRSVYV